MVIFRKKTLQTVLLSSSTISFKYFPVFRLECFRVRQIFFTKLVPGQVACKSHLPRRMRWLSHVTDGTSAAEIILHHLVVINKDI